MKIALIGYGKMGKTIEKLAIEKGHEVVYKSNKDSEEGDLTQADVAIEFSIPSSVVSNLEKCFDLGIPVVCGTTGWLEAYEDVVASCKQKQAAFLYASNFSLGVNLFFHINKLVANVMKDFPTYKLSIDEIHHTEKLDSPSGTAISLANDILPYQDKTRWEAEKSSPDSIPIYSFREEEVKGTHTVTYGSDIDLLSIKHVAHTREGFALGAILAAEWLKDKKGVHSMKDVLQLK